MTGVWRSEYNWGTRTRRHADHRDRDDPPRPAYLLADGSYDFSSRAIRCYVNDFGTDAYVLIVHGDHGDFIGAACDTHYDAAERGEDYADDFDLHYDVIEVAPGETIDLNIW